MTARSWAVALILLTANSASAFRRSTTPAGEPLAWVTNCIDFFIHEDGSDDINFNAVEAEVFSAFNEWEGQNCGDVNFTYSGVTRERRAGYFQNSGNINLIVWREGGGDDLDDWVHDPSIIAVTTNTYCTETNSLCPFKGAIIDADIEMNGERFRFTNSRVVALTEFDLGNTLTHEIGHLIGLDHSDDRASTMFASAPPSELSKRTLEEDDIDGLCEIFPLRGANEVECYQIGNVGGGGQSNASGSGGLSDCRTQPGQAPASPWWAALGLLLLWRRRTA